MLLSDSISIVKLSKIFVESPAIIVGWQMNIILLIILYKYLLATLPYLRRARARPPLLATHSSQLCKEHCAGKYASFYAVQYGRE